MIHPSGMIRLSAGLVNTFWHPFLQNITGPDISKYPLHEALKAIARPSVFTSQVNGAVGGVPLIEDFFITVLSGFDIVQVEVTSVQTEPSSAAGTFRMVHRRPFLGWKPSDGAAELHVDVPFYMRGEGCFHGGQLSHLTLRSPLADALREKPTVPPSVPELLENPDALRMLVALRRARVKPEIITERALRSASKKQDTWCSALGIL